MGAYLSHPNTTKESEDQQNKKLAYGVSSMQGWRYEQEDAHNCILDFDEETALFGVYDGHGGAEVAIYTSEKLPKFIKDNREYKNGDYEKALISAFLEFDDTLTSETAVKRLHEIIQTNEYKTKVNGSGDAEAEISVNCEPEPGSSKDVSSDEPSKESSSNSKDELSTNGTAESLINGSANVNGDITEEVEASSTESSAKESISNCDEKPSWKKYPGVRSGCAAVVALIKNDTLYVANAGDSRCVICKDGKAVDMSKDHKPSDNLEELRIVKAGGRVRHDRVNMELNLSRAIGDHQYKQNTELSNKEQMVIALPDVCMCKLEPDVEFIVLACDGIWELKTSQEVVNFIRPKIQSYQKLSTICEELFDALLAPDADSQNLGCDNMTCIIVKIRHDNDKITAELDSKQTTVTDDGETDSKETDICKNVKVDSTSAEVLKSADSSKKENDDKKDEAVPSQESSEAQPVSETEEPSSSSTRLKRSVDSMEEDECQAKRPETDMNVDSS